MHLVSIYFTFSSLGKECSFGNLKLGLFHKLNEKNEVAVSVEKNLASNDAPKVELGMQSLKRGNWDAKFKVI